MLDIGRSHGGNRADGLGDGAGLADAAGFNHNVVEALHGSNILQLLHQVHLQGTTNATILQGNEAVVLLTHNTALLNEACIDVHLTYIVHDNCKADSFLIGKNTV